MRDIPDLEMTEKEEREYELRRRATIEAVQDLWSDHWWWFLPLLML